jgi:hypothetical protein
MPIVQASISDPVMVDGQQLSAPPQGGLASTTISPPAPWIVTGTVVPNGNNPVMLMTYQVRDGPLNGFPPPAGAAAAAPVASQFSFSLTATDIPANGTYLVTIVAWDSTSAGVQYAFNVNAVNFAAVQTLSPPTTSLPPPTLPGGNGP